MASFSEVWEEEGSEGLTKTPCFESITTSTSRLPLSDDQRIVLPTIDGEERDHRNLLLYIS
jgi:hypothetical protein